MGLLLSNKGSLRRVPRERKSRQSLMPRVPAQTSPIFAQGDDVDLEQTNKQWALHGLVKQAPNLEALN